MKFCLITMSASLRVALLFHLNFLDAALKMRFYLYKNFSFCLYIWTLIQERHLIMLQLLSNEVDMVSIFELSKRFIQHFWLFYHSVCEAVREANFFHFFWQALPFFGLLGSLLKLCSFFIVLSKHILYHFSKSTILEVCCI